MPAMNKLTATEIERKIGSKRGRYSDGAGLYLQVGPTGKKSWLFQFTSRGKERQLGLGSADIVSLKQARDRAQAARDLLATGVDPIEQKHAARKAEALPTSETVSFEKMANEYMDAHSHSWKNEKHREQWTATLETYAYPIIGKLDVRDIATSHVLKILKPIWHEKPETASRVRGRIKTILDAAKAAGHRSGDNPAAWEAHLQHSLPALAKVKRVRPMPAMPYAEMPDFMAMLRQREGISARALEILILTATRTGSLIGMRDEELDFDKRVWVIPGLRMKGDQDQKDHTVPLPDRAIEILRSLNREKGNPHLFVGMREGSHISNMSMLQLMKHVAPKYVPHGFRSSFTDWANEETATPHHVVEMALAHVIDNQVERAYRRGDLLEKRRVLMTEWARYLYPSRARKR
jgi:integrase